jgi:hypothetical protein
MDRKDGTRINDESEQVQERHLSTEYGGHSLRSLRRLSLATCRSLHCAYRYGACGGTKHEDGQKAVKKSQRRGMPVDFGCNNDELLCHSKCSPGIEPCDTSKIRDEQ